MASQNAHAALIGEDGLVVQVIAIPRQENDDDNLITEYCNSINLPGRWIDTSYLGARRGKYAAVGDLYDQTRDVFVSVQPFPSWALDETGVWQSPIPRPKWTEDHLMIRWDEDSLSWIEEMRNE